MGKNELITEVNGDSIEEQIRNNIEKCTNDIELVSNKMIEIREQGGWNKFWNKGNNIDELAKYNEKITDIQKRSLDLIILLMGASFRVKRDYNTIIDSIEELTESHPENIEVLKYLNKMKQTILSLKNKSESMENYKNSINKLEKSVESLKVIVGVLTFFIIVLFII
jgi:DNA repair exonuclease SbcCD ATPase subunit